MKTLLVILCFAGAVSAQTFSFAVADTMMFAPPTVADVICSGVLTNTSSKPIDLLAIRRVNVTDPTWSTAICMEICMAAGVDTSGAYNIPPGGTQLFLLHFATTSTPSSGDVKIEFQDKSDTTNSIKQWFHMTTGGTSQFLWPQLNGNVFFREADTLRWKTTFTGLGQLAYSSDAGESWNEIDPAVQMADGKYVWTPEAQFVPTAKLRLRAAGGSLVSDLVKVTARFFSPLGGISIHNSQPDTITWTLGVTGAAEFDYSVNNGPWVKVTGAVNMATGLYIWTPAATINSSNVRVRLKTSAWSFASDAFAVTPLDAVREAIPESNVMTLSPNPAASYIVFNSRVSDLGQLAIVDATGKIVEHFSPVAYPFLLPVSDLPSGPYFLQFRGVNGISPLPFIVKR